MIIAEVVGLCDSPGRKLQCVFDRQPRLEGPVRLLFKQTAKMFPELVTPNVQPPRFADSATEMPLQAADLLAYETYKELKNRLEQPPRRTSGALDRLLHGRLHLAHYFDQERSAEILSQSLSGSAAEVVKERLPWPVYDSLSAARMDRALQRLAGQEAPPREPSWVDQLLERRPERLVLDSAHRTMVAVGTIQTRAISLHDSGVLSRADARRMVRLSVEVATVAGRLSDALRGPNKSSIVPVLGEYAEALKLLSDQLLPEITAEEPKNALIIHMESAAMLRHANLRRQPA